MTASGPAALAVSPRQSSHHVQREDAALPRPERALKGRHEARRVPGQMLPARKSLVADTLEVISVIKVYSFASKLMLYLKARRSFCKEARGL